MTESDEGDANASTGENSPVEPPRRVREPTDHDLYGRPVGFIDCDADAIGHWDDSRWSAHPPI